MKRLVILLVLIFIVVSCRKEATRWNSNWSTPLINDTLDLNNWVNDSTLSISNSGNYRVELKRELFRFDLNSIVGIPDTVVNTNYSLPISSNVPPGFSFVNNSEERNLQLNEIQLKKIILRKGELEIEVKNPYATKVFCSLTLPKVKKNGQVIVLNLEIEAGTVNNPTLGIKKIDLSDAEFDLTGLNSGSHNKLITQVAITSDPNGPAVFTSLSHVTQVKTALKNIQINYAKGYFGNQIFQDTTEIEVDLLKKWIDGSIDLPGLALNLKLSNGIKAIGRMNIKEVSTTKIDGSVTTLMSNELNNQKNINSAAGAWGSLVPSTLNYSFTSMNSSIESFLENAGPKVKIVYDFEINQLGNISGANDEIFPQSAVVLDLGLQMPLGLALDNFTVADTFELNFANNQKQIEQGRQATFRVELQNAFPVRGSLNISLLDENGDLIIQLLATQNIESALFGNHNANGVKVTNSSFECTLNEEDISKLKSVKSLSLSAIFDTPNPTSSSNSFVLLNENCFLGCKIRMDIQYENKYE